MRHRREDQKNILDDGGVSIRHVESVSGIIQAV